MLRVAQKMLFVVFGSMLFACGGSDVPKDDVTISLSYFPPQGTVGVPYAYYPNYHSSESISERFEISSGALPPGLGLSSGDGVISGTPSLAGSYNFSVKLTGKNLKGEIVVPTRITIVNPPSASSSSKASSSAATSSAASSAASSSAVSSSSSSK